MSDSGPKSDEVAPARSEKELSTSKTLDLDLQGPRLSEPVDLLIVGDQSISIDVAPNEPIIPPSPAQEPNASYFTDYELLLTIARGGMGVVYKARQKSLNRIVALKMIRTVDMASDDQVQRFLREAEAAAQLDHPGIVPIFEVGACQGQHYFTMGFVDGPSLERRVKEGPLPAQAAARLIRQVALAVEYAHGKGIIHRDLKPANILLDRDGTPKVTDFGLAKLVTGVSDLTQSGQILGTPSYMPPEQASGSFTDIGPSADVYSLGATLYCLLTARPPFQSAQPLDTLRQVLEQEPVSPRQLNAAISHDLETICLKCLHKEPARRYSSAAALAEDLSHHLAGEPILARPVGSMERFVRWCRRNPQVAALSLGTALSLLLGSVFASYFAIVANREAISSKNALALSEKRRYLAEVALVQKDLNEGQIPTAIRRLEGLRPREPGDTDLRGFEWYYLRRQCHPDLQTLDGPGGQVQTVAISPDGRRIALGGGINGQSGRVVIRDIRTGDKILDWAAHTAEVRSVAFSPDGTQIATGGGVQGRNGEVKIWNAATGNELAFLGTSAEPVWSVAFSPDGRRLAWAGVSKPGGNSSIGDIQIWNVEQAKTEFVLHGHISAVRSIAFSPNGRWIASGSADQTVRIWNASHGQAVATLREHSDTVTAVSFSPDSQRLISGGSDLNVKLWEARLWQTPTDSPASSITIRTTGRTCSAEFSPDGRHIAVGCDDHSIEILDAGTGKEDRTLRGHAGSVQGVVFSPDGWRFISASSDGTAKVWDLTAYPDNHPMRGYLSMVNGVAFCPDGRHFVSGGSDRAVRIWDTVEGRETLTFWGHAEDVRCVACSRDGRHAASGGSDRTIRIWDTTAARTPPIVLNCQGTVWGVAFDPTGRWVAGAIGNRGENGQVQVWDAATGQEHRSWPVGSSSTAWPAFRCVDFSPDGSLVAAGCADATVKIWDVATGQQKSTLSGHTTGAIVSVAFNPDGKSLASSGEDQTIRLWDLAAGKEIATLDSHPAIVSSIAYSPDGRRLAAAAADRTVRIWDTATAQEAFASHVLPIEVRSVAFSPDGRMLLGGGKRVLDTVFSLAIWDGREATAELTDQQEAQSVVTSLFAKGYSILDVSAMLQRDPTLRELVRAQALSFTDDFERTSVRRQAEQLLMEFANKGLLPSEIRDKVSTDSDLPKPVRIDALALVQVMPENPTALNRASRAVVRSPGAEKTAYDRALQQAETACRLTPFVEEYLVTLGMAQYRLMKYREAEASLSRASQSKGVARRSATPTGLAFLAMAQYQLDQRETARANLASLRTMLKESRWADDKAAQTYFQEAEQLIKDEP